MQNVPFARRKGHGCMIVARYPNPAGPPGMPTNPDHVSQMIAASAGGDRTALERLIPVVYDELRRIAARYIRRERRDHTLQPTALVHEAYACLVGQENLAWKDRTHFIGIAAMQMRQLLVQHARSHGRLKRGGGGVKVELEEVASPAAAALEVDVIMLDAALDRLAAVDEQVARVVELRYFGGLSIEEAAEVLGVSEATVKRDWRMAKAWLRNELSGGAAP
jgi:RNA polymerase sigma-70 factor, ECF subfamily